MACHLTIADAARVGKSATWYVISIKYCTMDSRYRSGLDKGTPLRDSLSGRNRYGAGLNLSL